MRHPRRVPYSPPHSRRAPWEPTCPLAQPCAEALRARPGKPGPVAARAVCRERSAFKGGALERRPHVLV